MASLFNLEKNDNNFVESACNASRRRAMIEQLEKGRKIQLVFLGVRLIFCILGLILLFVSRGQMVAIAITVLFFWSAATYFTVYHRVDTQIKVLKTFERMESLPKADGE